MKNDGRRWFKTKAEVEEYIEQTGLPAEPVLMGYKSGSDAQWTYKLSEEEWPVKKPSC